MEPDTMILVFWMLSCKPTFSLSSFTFIKRLFNYSSLSAIRVVLSAYMYVNPYFDQFIFLKSKYQLSISDENLVIKILYRYKNIIL